MTTTLGTRTGLLALTWVVCMSGLLGSGCRTPEPVTGRRQFIVTSPAQEMKAGKEAWEDILKKEKRSTHKERTAALERVGRAVAAAANQPEFEWEFVLFASDEANAFCLPGGKVGVYEGLFRHARNDAQLSTVVAHEVAHAIARHGGERMTQSLLLGAGAVAIGVAADKEDRDKWLLAYGGISTLGYVLPYSRKQEYAADEIGLKIMARAGYDPQAAVDFWKNFSQESSMPEAMEFLSTHPVDTKRIRRLEELLPRTRFDYETAHPKHGFGETYPADWATPNKEKEKPAAEPPGLRRRGRGRRAPDADSPKPPPMGHPETAPEKHDTAGSGSTLPPAPSGTRTDSD